MGIGRRGSQVPGPQFSVIGYRFSVLVPGAQFSAIGYRLSAIGYRFLVLTHDQSQHFLRNDTGG